MKLLQYEDFAGRLNESFVIDLGTSTMEMVLNAVRPIHKYAHPALMRLPFDLLFNSHSQVVLPQRTYLFENQTIGKLEIFISPIARNKDGIIYQAVFN